MDKINNQKELLELISPIAIASSATRAVEKDGCKIVLIASKHLTKVNPETCPSSSMKDKFLGTRFGKLLLNPFGYHFEIKEPI